MNDDFIVIKYHISTAIKDAGFAPAWGKVTVKNSPQRGKGKKYGLAIKILDEQTAKRLIRDHELVKAISCESGVVWDTPNKVFLKKYGGKINYPLAGEYFGC